jgi:hypothetical protein
VADPRELGAPRVGREPLDQAERDLGGPAAKGRPWLADVELAAYEDRPRCADLAGGERTMVRDESLTPITYRMRGRLGRIVTSASTAAVASPVSLCSSNRSIRPAAIGEGQLDTSGLRRGCVDACDGAGALPRMASTAVARDWHPACGASACSRRVD